MKTSITYTLNVLFTLVIFTPFVYTQTSNKISQNGGKANIVKEVTKPTEQTYLINTQKKLQATRTLK